MDWLQLTPAAVLPLVGVLLGTLGSLATTHLGTRTTRKQAETQRRAALRIERKEAIRDFLEGAQRVEHLAERRYQTGERDNNEAELLTHRMWYLQKCIELVGGHELRRAALDYAWHLGDAVYKELPTDRDIWEFMTSYREPFLEAARRTLAIPE
ncbi:hypothetical protein [Amycolatopsis sp. NPDC051061]|uniref:hypothetical protein n=1 Tax=Amycolatopsis sp. NPDC051061 TaxID=3155042 RepID=UPI003443D086